MSKRGSVTYVINRNINFTISVSSTVVSAPSAAMKARQEPTGCDQILEKVTDAIAKCDGNLYAGA